MKNAMVNGFLLPQRFNVEKLIARLEQLGPVGVGDSAAFALRFFDSFDWRLHRADLRLIQMSSPGGVVLRLKPSLGGEPLHSLVFAGKPAWPADLPHSALRDTVAGLLDMRVLLELALVKGTATDLRVLNEDGKTVAWVQYLEMACTADTVDEPRTLWPRIRLLPVKGYEGELERLTAFFADEMEWPTAPDCLFDEAITAVGRETGDYSSKLDLVLSPDQMAVASMRRILLTLLDTLERNIPGTRADLDSEFLHDLRVATRRTRSALSQVKRVLPDEVVSEYKQRMAWLGQITGPTRDLDVFLLELPRYRASLPANMGDDLDALGGYLQKLHRTEQGRLKRKLGSPEMKSLLSDWRRVLEAEAFPGEAGWLADLPIERVATRRIWRMYKKVLKDGRAVHLDGPPEEMHELRKDCKKLRYLIEFFRSLYPAKEIKPLIKALKGLLDILGDFQDLEVQAGKLTALAGHFKDGDEQQVRTVMAIGALVADLLRLQQAAHERFAERFAAFDSPENRARYKRLFKTEDGDKA